MHLRQPRSTTRSRERRPCPRPRAFHSPWQASDRVFHLPTVANTPCTLLRVLSQRPHPSQIPPPHAIFVSCTLSLERGGRGTTSCDRT